MSGYSEAAYSCMSSIQVFWLVALAAAERIATSPAPPICSAIRSTCEVAMPSASAWLMNRSRHSGSVSESKVTTLVPALLASSRASQMAVGSLAETTRLSTPCWAAVLMNGTWASGVAVSGPTISKLPPNSSDALVAPVALASK